MGEWAKAYDLAEDKETVELVQRATRTTSDFGLEPEVALYGSEAWWKAIEDGRIPKREVQGTISRVYTTGHGDWPEFELDTGTEKTRWTRFGDKTLYREGGEAKVEYVIQKRRKPVLGQLEQKEVIRIFVCLKAEE
jgi:hypothetical protein